MKRAVAILVCLLLLLGVGVAYNQCTEKPCGQASCAAPCGANCAAAPACPSGAGCTPACATCPTKGQCADCDCLACQCAKGNCADCELKCCATMATVAGTVRYVRSTNGAVKVVAGEKGVLLRVKSGCPKGATLQAKLAALTKGDAVTAKYTTCPKTGRSYLVDITGGATAAESAATTPAGCPASGGCGGCGGQ